MDRLANYSHFINYSKLRMNSTSKVERKFDLICLGRLAVDLYGQQIGAQLEDVTSFARYLGGSSANIAAGCARLGLKVSMLSRVGNEQFGRFLKTSLQKEGCDTSHVQVDEKRLTALAILSIKDKTNFPLLFYRDNCADMAIDESHIDETHIASARALLITGTHFSTEQVKRASLRALQYAKRNSTTTILDIDYRPVLWGLTQAGDGETRFVASASVSAHLQSILPHFDLIVGTEEEFHIAGGSENTVESLRTIRSLTPAILVVKLGSQGCIVLENDIPHDLQSVQLHKGFQVDVLNVLGAGDAFMSGFLSHWLRGKDFSESCTAANACGALVVSRHACSPAMPTPEELAYFLENHHNGKQAQRVVSRLHRMSQQDSDYSNLAILAFDHRSQFVNMAREVGAELTVLPKLKKLMLDGFLSAVKKSRLHNRCGVLIDDTYGRDELARLSDSNMWIARPVEQPGSRPLEFEGGRNIGLRIHDWPKKHIVKCLVYYHPDDETILRYEQERQICELHQSCTTTGHQLLLEIISPKKRDGQAIIRTLERLYNLDVHPHWWKLPSLDNAQWQRVQQLVKDRSPHCRGVVLLGLNATTEELKQSFSVAAKHNICKGFAIGRSIFREPSEAWLRGAISDDTYTLQIQKNYLQMVEIWDNST